MLYCFHFAVLRKAWLLEANIASINILIENLLNYPFNFINFPMSQGEKRTNLKLLYDVNVLIENAHLNGEGIKDGKPNNRVTFHYFISRFKAFYHNNVYRIRSVIAIKTALIKCVLPFYPFLIKQR